MLVNKTFTHLQEENKGMSPRHSAYIPPSVKLSLKLYTSVDDERFPWLMGILYGYTTWVIFQIGKHLY